MVPIDVLVIGAGLQGLLALDAVTVAGYSAVLVAHDDVGSGQTLHSHGVLNAGFGTAGAGPVELLRQVVLPDLARRGVATYGDWYLVGPPGSAGGQPADPPPALAAYRGRVRPLPEVNVNKVELVTRLVSPQAARIVRGTVTGVHREPSGEVRTVDVASAARADRLTFAPSAVIVAAGTGTKALLRRVGAHESQLEPIRHRRVHVLCVRGPRGVLPVLNAVWMAEQIFVAAHESAETVTWYATPVQPGGQHVESAPPDAAAEIDPRTVADGWARLAALYPPLTSTAGLRFCSYAGYRQDIGDAPGLPMCARVEGAPNVVAALPSSLIGAWPVARQAVQLASETVRRRHPQPDLRAELRCASVGRPTEDADDVQWTGSP